jgi:hypothetical protein
VNHAQSGPYTSAQSHRRLLKQDSFGTTLQQLMQALEFFYLSASTIINLVATKLFLRGDTCLPFAFEGISISLAT